MHILRAATSAMTFLLLRVKAEYQTLDGLSTPTHTDSYMAYLTFLFDLDHCFQHTRRS